MYACILYVGMCVRIYVCMYLCIQGLPEKETFQNFSYRRHFKKYRSTFWYKENTIIFLSFAVYYNEVRYRIFSFMCFSSLKNVEAI